MDKFDIVRILSFGVVGLGFLLAIMAYNLLRKEQKRETPHASVLKSISQFMSFSIVMAALGLGSELIRIYLAPKQDNSTYVSEKLFTEGDSKKGSLERPSELMLENYDLEDLQVKIVASKEGPDDNDIDFKKARSLVEVSKSQTEELCFRGKGVGFVINRQAIFGWKVFDVANNLLIKYQYGFRPNASTWYVWSCRQDVLNYPIGEYLLEFKIQGNTRKLRFRLVQ